MYRLLLIVFLLVSLFSLGQNRGGVVVGNTTQDDQSWKKVLGVVVGVSKYQHIGSLDYADKDAISFYNMLLHPKAYHADSSMVSLLINEQATWTKIWVEIQKIQRRAEPGDLFFIYFAGHGDSYNAEDTYLLGHDAPPGDDPNNYLGNALPVYQLKTRIKELTQRGVKVVLITDACRSRELAGGTAGMNTFLEKVMEKNVGQLQITSCQSNQLSEEGMQWGGGRGVFSYYLVDALSGLADKDGDQIVTMSELQTYLIDSVTKATKGISSPMPRQIPYICCPDNPYAVLSKPAKMYTQYYLMAKQQSQSNIQNSAQLAVRKRFATSLKPEQQSYIDSFNVCIKQKRYFEGSISALFYLEQIKKSGVSDFDYFDLQDNLLAAMGDHIQSLMNVYIEGKQYGKYKTLKQVDAEFAEAARMANEIKRILGAKHYFSKEYESKRYFLLARSLVHSNDKALLNLALMHCDSSLLLEPDRAYVYNTQGLIYAELNEYEKAMSAFRKASELAPNWAFVYNNIAMIYAKQDNYELATRYYIKAISIDVNYPVAKNNLAFLYYKLNEPEKALALTITVLEKDASDADALNFSALAYELMKDTLRAQVMYEKAMQADTTDMTVVNNYATLCFEIGRYKKAADLLIKYLKYDPDHQTNRLLLAYSYAYTKDCKPAMQALTPLIHSDDAEVLYNIACILSICDNKDGAFTALEKSFKAGFKDVKRIKAEKDFKNIAKDTRWDALLKKYLAGY